MRQLKINKLREHKREAVLAVALLVIVLTVVSISQIIGKNPIIIFQEQRQWQIAADAPDSFYFTNTASPSGITPAGKMMDLNADNDTEYTVTFSSTNTDWYWYSDEIPSGAEDGGIDAGTYTQTLYFNNYAGPAAGPGGETQRAAYSIVPPMGGKAVINFGVTFFNTSNTTANVTKVAIRQADESDPTNKILFQTIGQGYPASNWTEDADSMGMTWALADPGVDVDPRSALTFWGTAKNNKDALKTFINTTTTVDGVEYYHSGVYETEGTATEWSATQLCLDTDSDITDCEYEETSTGGIEDTYYVVAQEISGKLPVSSGASLYIDIPSDFTGMTCPDQTPNWDTNDCAASSSFILASTTVAIAKGADLAYQFQAIPPSYATSSTYRLHGRFYGTDGNYTYNSNANMAIEVAGAADNLIFKSYVSHCATTTATGGETTRFAYSNVPSPADKDQYVNFGVTYFNGLATTSNVTEVIIRLDDPTVGTPPFWDNVTAGYPASTWTEDGDGGGVVWSGSEDVDPLTATVFWVKLDSSKSDGASTINTTTTADGEKYIHNGYPTSNWNANAGAAVLYYDTNGDLTDFEYDAISSPGGVEDTYTVVVGEQGGKGTLSSGNSLYIDIPSGFTGVNCDTQTDWTNQTCTNTQVTASTSAQIATGGELAYAFNATPPEYATSSVHRLHVNFTGTDGISKVVDSHANLPIEVAADAYSCTEIATSTNMTITSGTSSPTSTDMEGAAQTFTAANPERLQVHLDYVSGGASVQIQYNDNDTNPSRLDTPAVDWGAEAGNNIPSISWLTGLHNDVSITLNEWTEGGSGLYNVSTTFRVTDDDGWDDISTTTIFVYRSGVVKTGNCSSTVDSDIQECYPSTSSDSWWSPFSGSYPEYGQGAICSLLATATDSADFWCTTTLYYVATATDATAADWSAEWWDVIASTSDKSGGYATASRGDTSIDVNTLQAIELSTTSIYYTGLSGAITAGSNTVNRWTTTTATTTGNVAIDLHFLGGDLTGPGTITATFQEFSTTSGLTWGDYNTVNMVSTSTGETHDLNMLRPTSTVPYPSSADEIYWGIGIPTGSAVGTYTGTNTLTGTSTVADP